MEGGKGFKKGIQLCQNLLIEFFGSSHDIGNGDHVCLGLNIFQVLDIRESFLGEFLEGKWGHTTMQEGLHGLIMKFETNNVPNEFHVDCVLHMEVVLLFAVKKGL